MDDKQRTTSNLSRRQRLGVLVSGRAFISGLVITLIASSPWFFASFGIGRLPIVAGLVAWRSLLTFALLLLVVILLSLASFRRPFRRFILGLLVPLVPLAAIAGGTLAPFNWNPQSATVATNQITILSWNINGSLIDPPLLVQEVERHHPDIVVLPSIDDEILEPAARALATRGYTLIHPAGSETAILSARDDIPAPPSDYGADKASEAIAQTTSGSLRIIGVHLRIPFFPGGNSSWNREVRWLGTLCETGAPALIVGDFNATNDNVIGSSLDRCPDAARVAGADRVGTWPTALSPMLGMPIDHLFISGNAAEVRSFEVLGDQDDSGVRHRPILVTLALST